MTDWRKITWADSTSKYQLRICFYSPSECSSLFVKRKMKMTYIWWVSFRYQIYMSLAIILCHSKIYIQIYQSDSFAVFLWRRTNFPVTKVNQRGLIFLVVFKHVQFSLKFGYVPISWNHYRPQFVIIPCALQIHALKSQKQHIKIVHNNYTLFLDCPPPWH